MKKMLALLCCAALAACTEAPAAPAPDPEAVEQLVSRLEAQQAVERKAPDKLAKAERVATVIERADPEKLGSVAEGLLGR